jgi:DNA-binding transcriptional ArsR family regulator
MANVAAGIVSARIELAHPPRALADASLIPAAIIQNPTIRPGAKLTYSKLIEYARGREVATNNRLAADLVVSPRSVRNYIAALRAAGLVEVRRHSGKPNSYRLTSADK